MYLGTGWGNYIVWDWLRVLHNLSWSIVIYSYILWSIVISRDLLWSFMVYCDLSWSTYCDISLYIVIHHDILLSIMIYGDLLWYIVIDHNVSWSIMIDHDLAWSNHTLVFLPPTPMTTGPAKLRLLRWKPSWRGWPGPGTFPLGMLPLAIKCWTAFCSFT